MEDIVTINADQICSDCHTFIDGSTRCVTKLLSVKVGRGVYNPGWRWSIHAGPQTGKASARHIGWVQSGKMIIRTANNNAVEVGPGDFLKLVQVTMPGLWAMNHALL